MELLINIESLRPPQTGIGTYTAGLLGEYQRQGMPQPIHVYRKGRILPLANISAVAEEAPSPDRTISNRILPLLQGTAKAWNFPYLAWRRLDRAAFRRASRNFGEGVVYHEPNFILKPFAGPSVVTVHDLSHLRFPKFHPRARVSFLESHLEASLKRAEQIITVSDTIRRELIETFSLGTAKVSSIPLGVSERFRPVDSKQLAELESKYGLLSGRYVLCVATREPRKNLLTLFRAFESLPPTLRDRYKLVICGARGWHGDETDRHAARLSARGWLKQLGYVPRAALPALYSGAAVFAFPSIYEGFGLPVLEAMACGTPSVIGRDTAMAEFAGDSAAKCQPGEPGAVAEQLTRLLEDDSARHYCSGRALELARNYSWKRCAKDHLEVYRKALAGR